MSYRYNRAIGTAVLLAAFLALPVGAYADSGISGTTLAMKKNCSVWFSSADRCVDKPASASMVIISLQYPYTVKRVVSADNGTFSLSLPPGDYGLYPAPSAALAPLSSRRRIQVKEDAYTPVVLYYRYITLGGFWWGN